MAVTRSGPQQVVLDSNVAGAFLFKEQNTTEAEKVLQWLEDGALIAFVPSLFWAELQQICFKKTLTTSSAKGLSPAQAETQYRKAQTLPLNESRTALADYREQAWKLIKELGVGSYDAYYLALGLDIGAAVWTFDAKFRNRVTGPRDGQVLLLGTDPAI